MPDLREDPKPRFHWLRPIVGDVQFWIPLTVLIAGLLLLKWVA
jgi:hypothetical protein